LQLTFWEHATAMTGEMLGLLVFAYSIRCLLEYRIDGHESWLTRLALVYGLGVTDNWAMIGFFPAFLVALVWIKGRSFFQARFLIRLCGWGMAGLLLYLLLPLVGTLAAGESLPYFWQLLKANLAAQKKVLFAFPKARVLLCSLTSVLPVLVMGIRWPSTFGDLSAVGVALANLMSRVAHGVFLAGALFVAFDPVFGEQRLGFSPRHLGYGLPFLTFYYLGALAAGYYCGYFLLVFGRPSEHAWERARGPMRLLNPVLTGAVWVSLVAVPAGLLYRNFPHIRAGRGPELAALVSAKVKHLPVGGAVVMSDDPVNLTLIDGGLRRQGTRDRFVLIDTRAMPFHRYQRALVARYPGRWPDILTGTTRHDPLDSFALLQLLATAASSNAVCYLHPSFGYYFEAFHLEPHGPVYRLRPYGSNQITAPLLTEEVIRENVAFWEGHRPQLDRVAMLVQRREPGALALGRNYSLALNHWGVELQRARRLAEAARSFEQALELNPVNLTAQINLNLNRQLQAGHTPGGDIPKAIHDQFGRFRSWDELLGVNGPVDDPSFRTHLGQVWAGNFQYHQAATEFERVTQLQPDNFAAHLALAGVCLEGPWPDEALRIVTRLRERHPPGQLAATNQLELVRLEALVHFRKGDLAGAEQRLKGARAAFPANDTLLGTLSQVYLLSGRFTNALEVITEQLQRTPDNPRALLNQGAIYIQTKRFDQALPPLNRVLELQPENRPARMNRAIAHLETGQLDAAQKDYEALRTVLPGLHAVHYGLGEIAWRRNNRAAALAHYSRYLELAPDQGEERPRIVQRVQELRGAQR
jgi:tetratricopeptide (TPR) repeat protein